MKTGTQLGPYRIERELGNGGMGAVYLATVTEAAPGTDVGVPVALKVVHPHLLEQRGFFKRFLREADIGKSIDHENVVRTFDVDQLVVDGTPRSYMAMEYVEGRTLRALFEELRQVPESLLRLIAQQIAAGLAAIHATGIVHRDIKPENVLITDGDEVRIMDLGVARLQEQTIALTREGQFTGSLLYASPEQFDGRSVGPAADLYSLGVVLYELATGVNPFERDKMAALIKAHLHEHPKRARERSGNVSPFLSEVIDTLLQKDDAARFAGAAELRDVLDEAEDSGWWRAREKDVRARETAVPAIQVRRETALHGREQALEELVAAWDAARGGRGGTVLIEGEIGIGKSRLVDHFVRENAGGGVHVLYGSYPPSGGMGGLSDALVDKFGGASLADEIAPYLSATPDLVPAFAALAQNARPPTGAQTIGGDALHSLFTNLMRALAEESATIWIVDDIHYAPAESRQLLLAMARVAPSARVLFILTSEPDLADDTATHLSRSDGFRRIELPRLSARQVIELLRDAFRSTTLAEKLGGKIAYKSDGVPFFVFELIRGLREGKFLSQLPDGTYVESRLVEDIEVPSAVRDLVEARLSDLSDEDRELLDAAAVQGYEFEPRLVARVFELAPIKVLQRLAALERRTGIIRGEGARCRFDHHQIQEVLYRSQMAGLREEYHAAFADEMAERVEGEDPQEVDGETALFLAYHGLRGSRPRTAAPYVRRALEHLGSLFRSEEAADIADRALAKRELLTGADRVSVLMSRANAPDIQADHARQQELLREAVDIAGGLDDTKLHAQATRGLGHVLEPTDPDEAVATLERAIELAREAEDPATESAGHTCIAVVHWFAQRLDAGQLRIRQALDAARAAGERGAEANALNNLGILASFSGRLAEAREQYRQALEIARADDLRGILGRVVDALGSWHLSVGDDEAGRLAYEEAATLGRTTCELTYELSARVGLADITARGGDVAAARRELEAVLARSVELRRRDHQLEWGVVLGRLEAESGDTAAARARLAEAFAEASKASSTAALVTAAALGARYGAVPYDDAASTLDEHRESVARATRMDAAFSLWHARRDPAHLAAAHEALSFLREYAPEEYRESLVENVPLHRDIAAAWAEHGATD